MAAGKYSAGRIFLQVVPSFKGVQREISQQVKKYNNAMEKELEQGSEKGAAARGRKAAKAQSKSFADVMADARKVDIAEDAKYHFALAKQRAKAAEDQQRAAEKAAQAEIDLWQKRIDEAVKGSNKIREEQARARKKELEEQAKQEKKLGRMQAAAYAEDARREKAKLDRAQKQWDDLGKLQDQAYAEDRKRARKAEREEAARWDRLGRLQEQAYAEDIRRTRKKADDLRKINDREAREQAKVLERQARDLAKHRAQVEKDERDWMRRRGGAARDILEKAFGDIDKNLGGPSISGRYAREFDKIKRSARSLSDDLSRGFIDPAQARTRLREVERDLRRISRLGSGATPDERSNARTTLNALRDMRREYDNLGRSSSRLGTFLKGATRDSEDGANAFRIFNYRVLGVVTALPLLVPLLAVAAGGLVAFGTAATGAAAGLGVMLLGFSGIGAAVKAFGEVQDNAVKDNLMYTKTMRNAGRAVRDAAQGLARARMDAARSAEDSSRRIADAEKKVADSQKDATKAQNDLREARKQAQQEQQDLADKIKAGALDERQALIDLFNAQVDYNATMADGGATNLEKEQSSINLERARLAIKGIRKENAALIAEQKKGAQQGPDGNPAVVAAQDRVTQSLDAQKQAQQDLADARRDADQAAVDSALRIRDAQEHLADTQAAYREALVKTGDVGSASLDKLNTALGKLSPAGREFAGYIASLRDDFFDLRAIAQEGMLPGVESAMKNVIGRYGPEFKQFIGTMSKQMGAFFVQVGNMLTSPAWVSFFNTMAEMAPQFSADFGSTFLNFLTGAVSLMDAFAPYAKDVSAAILGISQGFADWAGNLKGTDGFQRFLGYLEKTGPKVWDLLEQIVLAFVNLGIALAPIADKLLDFAIAFFGWIAGLDPKTLSAIVTAILGFVLASQLAAGITQLLITVTTPFHSLLGALAFALVGLGVAMLWAYQHSETFKKIIDTIFGFIRDHWQIFAVLGGVVMTLGTAFFGVFKVLSFIHGPLRAVQIMFGLMRIGMAALFGPVGLIIMAVIALGAALIYAYKHSETFRNIVDSVFSFVGKVISLWWNNYAKPILGFFWKAIKDWGAVLWWFWGSVVGPVFQLIGAIFKATWDKIISPIIGWIGGKFGWLGDKISEVWMKYVNPVLDKFGLGADDLKRVWQTAIDAIGKAWESLKSLVYKPIEFIVNTIINRGFVDNFNKLADIFGTKKIPHLMLPSMNTKADSAERLLSNGGKSTKGGSFYTGGYTGPGAKYQPAGVVHADEYVIRKESTNKIRSKYGLEVLDYVNRFGDLPGMGGYATGGLVTFGKRLQAMGFNVSENPAFGGVHPVHTKNSWHYRNGAIDVNYDGHGQAFENARINSILGLAKQYGLRTIWQYPGHFDHAHFDIGKGADLGNFAGASRDGSGGGDLPWYLDKPIDYLRKAVNTLSSTFKLDGPIGDFVTKVPLKVIDFAAEKISKIISGGNGDFDTTRDYNNPMYGVQQWRGVVSSALARVGQSQRLVDVVLARMNQESSGDSKAINLWDANAKAGHPSKGLMQLIDSTFSAYRDKGLPNDIWNPMSNVVASMRYALGHYGSLEAAYTRAGGYADGGLVTEGGSGLQDNGTMMYDNGGYLPPGITQVVNLTGRPEPVFTADQFADMQGGGGRGALINHLEVPVIGSDLTASDVVGEIMHTVKRVDHGGKYAGRSN